MDAKGLKGEIADTPNPGEYILKEPIIILSATIRIALEAAADKRKPLGFALFIITDKINGDANEEAKKWVIYLSLYRSAKPACILMGGETTVTVKGKGKGGRNQQFALAALQELINHNTDTNRVPLILSAGTDGTDGPTEATGALIDADTIKKTSELGLDISSFLKNNDAYNFFAKAGGHIITGPTHTNVMDIVIALV